jgi:hypothetical protein
MKQLVEPMQIQITEQRRNYRLNAKDNMARTAMWTSRDLVDIRRLDPSRNLASESNGGW